MSYCPRCGAATNQGASFCAACGTTLAPPAPAPTVGAPAAMHPTAAPPARAAYPAATTNERPVGVTIVSVVMIVGAAFAALGIVGLLFMAMVIGTAFSGIFGDSFWFDWFEAGASIAMAFLFLLAIFVLAMAAFAVATGVGSLRGASWAWAATIVVMALVGLNALGSLASRDASGIIGLLAAGLVIWYYFRPEVKAWFKRG